MKYFENKHQKTFLSQFNWLYCIYTNLKRNYIMKNEEIWQVVHGTNMGPTLQSWTEDEKEAERVLVECIEMWPNQDFWIEKGTEYIYNTCKHCGTVHANECFDAYGITTGYWCTECYNSSNYPYRKDRYDYQGAGERLDFDE